MEYPEHEKLQKIQKVSQACGAMLDWLQNEKKIVLSEYGKNDFLFPVRIPIQTLLAEYFGIDQKVLEQEKQAMIESLRK